MSNSLVCTNDASYFKTKPGQARFSCSPMSSHASRLIKPYLSREASCAPPSENHPGLIADVCLASFINETADDLSHRDKASRLITDDVGSCRSFASDSRT